MAQRNKLIRDQRELKLGLLAIQGIDPKSLFPEINIEGDDDDDASQEMPDDTPTKYVFTNAEVDHQQVEEEIRQMLALASQGQTSFKDVPTYTEWV
jgi:hypothetical protein